MGNLGNPALRLKEFYYNEITRSPFPSSSDVETSYRLELLSPVSTSNSFKGNHSSLFDLLDYCNTAIGKRTLRARILEPTCDVPDINIMHNCIRELNTSKHLPTYAALDEILKNFHCVDRLCKLTMIVPQVSQI